MRRDPKENSQKPDEGIGKSVPQGFHSNDFLIPRTSVKLNLEFLKKKKKKTLLTGTSNHLKYLEID